jgi:hypothetical protein
MNVEFIPEVKSELFDAVAYYDDEISGVGRRFCDEADQHIAWT